MRNPFKKKYSNKDIDFVIDMLFQEINWLIDDIQKLKDDVADLTDFVEDNLD